MRFAIAYSKKDIAGINIIQQFKELAFAPEIPIIELKKESIYSEDIDKLPELRNIDFLIFATKHRSVKGEKSLSIHAPGNWRNADYGGKPGKICNTSAQVIKYLFQNLNKLAEDETLKDYKITLECTHHGPLIKKPCCFIELGSSEAQWEEKAPAKVLAKTIISLQNFKLNSKYIPVIGIGGPHYCPSFNKIQLNSDYAISHIIPEYALPMIKTMLKEAEEKTTEQIKTVILDWKGCGKSEQRQEIISLIEQAGLRYKRTSEVEK
jgi:D-aminoacyl-tRNA deacylase